MEPCGGRKNLINIFPNKLKELQKGGADTTMMVWADLDDDMEDGECLKNAFWAKAQEDGISQDLFETVVFVFAKDRIENWVEFLLTGATDEDREGPRLKNNKEAADAARRLAELCISGAPIPDVPPSLDWSCRNWRALVKRMR